jgi:hypothetical protein
VPKSRATGSCYFLKKDFFMPTYDKLTIYFQFLSFLFFLTKKSRKKECSAFFPGQRTRITKDRNIFIGLDEVVADSAACYQATQEALLFRMHFLQKKVFYIRRKRGAGNIF